MSFQAAGYFDIVFKPALEQFVITTAGCIFFASSMACFVGMAGWTANRFRSDPIPVAFIFQATLGLSFAAVLVGYASGVSREAATGEVLPVVLSGLGALALYSVLKKEIAVSAAVGTVVVFGISLLAGLNWGSVTREFGGPQFQTNEPTYGINTEGLS